MSLPTGRHGQMGLGRRLERCARDAQRRNELQKLGLRVYEFTWEDVTRRPAWVLRETRRRLEQAGWSPNPVLVTKDT
jgi:very-short-patch-repair endonuclease